MRLTSPPPSTRQYRDMRRYKRRRGEYTPEVSYFLPATHYQRLPLPPLLPSTTPESREQEEERAITSVSASSLPLLPSLLLPQAQSQRAHFPRRYFLPSFSYDSSSACYCHMIFSPSSIIEDIECPLFFFFLSFSFLLTAFFKMLGDVSSLSLTGRESRLPQPHFLLLEVRPSASI